MYRIITPAVTVFCGNEKPDYAANGKVLDFLIGNGVDGVVVLGSTGEFPGLTKEEKQDYFKFCAGYAGGRVPLYAGTGCMNLSDTVELSNGALKAGYEAVMVIGPYYYGIDQDKLFLYYDTLAKRLDGKMLLYNYPARTGHSLAPLTVERLAQANSNIIGIKDSVTEPHHTSLIGTAMAGKSFETFSGFDDQFLYNISFAGAGCIGGLSNIVPDIWSALVRAANNRDFDRSVALSGLIHRLMALYDMDSNCPMLLKKLMIRRGLDIAPTAVFPYNQLDDTVFQAACGLVDAVLADFIRLSH